LLFPAWCLQHLTGNTCTALTKYLDILTRVWTLCKTFSEGDFFLDLRKKCHTLLDDLEEEGLEVVDPEISQLDPNDLGEDFTRAVMDSCYGLRPDSTEEEGRRWQREKEEFCKFPLTVGIEHDLCILVPPVVAGPPLAMTDKSPSGRRKN
jgi:hypothetical protein